MGIIAGVTVLGGVGVLRADAHQLFAGLTSRGLSLIVVTAVFGSVSLALLLRRRYVAVRVTAAVAVVAVLWDGGWLNIRISWSGRRPSTQLRLRTAR
jgi:cytochrome d ubiquinol oxidase subunit II